MTTPVSHPTGPAKPASPYRHAEYYGALDGFRGLLALIVAVYHTPWESWFNNTAFMDNGTVIIDLFFVFSGFLMFRLYGAKIKGVEDGRQFLWRRLARLYPIHFVMTLVFVAFAVLRLTAHKFGLSTLDPGEVLPFTAGASEGWWSLYTNLTLTHAMGMHDSLTFNPPSWTISVEFFAYFVFAAMLIWARPTRRWHFGLMTLAIAAVYIWLSRIKPDMNITYDVAFFRCLAGFFTGVVAARIYGWQQSRATGEGGSVTRSTVIEVAMVLAYILFVALMGGKLQFLVGLFALGFVLIFARDAGGVSKVMMAPVFRYLAKVSYSVYMIHVIIALVFDIFAARVLSKLFGAGWHDTAVWGDLYIVPYLLIVVGAAHLCVRYVERPGGRLIMRLSQRRADKSAKLTA